MKIGLHISPTIKYHGLPIALACEVMQSPPRLSVCLFPRYLRNRLTVVLELFYASRSWP